MIKIVPLSEGTAFIAAVTCLADGLANTSPAADALNSPLPTKPTVPGSCPEPPPQMSETLERSWSARYTTFWDGMSER